MAFIDERFSESFSYGSNLGSDYAVEVTETVAGNEYRRQINPYQKLSIDLDFSNRTEEWLESNIRDFYDRSGGRFGTFRWKNPTDYSTNGAKGVPTANDQACVAVGSDYQITKWYGTEEATNSARRRIRKPNTGTVLVGIRDDFNNPVSITATGVSPERWTVDESTGLITFAPNTTYAITDISQAANAVVTTGTHSLVADDSVHLSGVTGMTEINGLRGTVQSVTATTITVDIDSTGFTAFSLSSPNAGVVNTAPQSNETVTAGCYFDIPVRFDSDSVEQFLTRNSSNVIMGTSIRLIEVLNP
jgi:uncharacterized protein (TIGR02217 family)